MNEFMGVNVYPVDRDVRGDFAILTGQVPVSGKVETAAHGYVLNGRLNDSFTAVNLLLDRGIEVRRVSKAVSNLHPGDFIVINGKESILEKTAQQTGVDFKALKSKIEEGIYRVKRQRIGMYQRFYGGNMDEGWTRFLLEQFAFPYTSLMDNEIKKGNLHKKYDVIILPHDREGMIMGEIPQAYRRYLSTYPPEYRSGIGRKGVKALREFVRKGGVLVALGDASGFAIKKFELSVRNAVAGKSRTDFFCPGSTVWASINSSHPFAYGMPSEGVAKNT